MKNIEAVGTIYTFTEDRGTCGFCGKEENGYAKRNANGEFQAACWACVNKDRVISEQQKRKPVGTTFTEDKDLDEVKPAAKKNPGVAPSTYRPKVN